MLQSGSKVEEGSAKEGPLDAAELARTIVYAIEDRKGENIVMLDLRALTPIADYFVIGTADNERQLRALVRAVEEHARERHDVKARRIEGDPESGWVLMDYSWVIAHLFSRHQRDFYRLEALWDDAPVVLRIQ
jgi:ribosome-associated protein